MEATKNTFKAPGASADSTFQFSIAVEKVEILLRGRFETAKDFFCSPDFVEAFSVENG